MVTLSPGPNAYSMQLPEILYPRDLGTVKALPRKVGALSVVEIEGGFAYD